MHTLFNRKHIDDWYLLLINKNCRKYTQSIANFVLGFTFLPVQLWYWNERKDKLNLIERFYTSRHVHNNKNRPVIRIEINETNKCSCFFLFRFACCLSYRRNLDLNSLISRWNWKRQTSEQIQQKKKNRFVDPFSSTQNYRLSAGNSTVICFGLFQL